MMSKAGFKGEDKYSKKTLLLYEEIKNEISKLSNTGIFNNRKIALAGCWAHAKDVIEILSSIDLQVSFIVDNDANKHGISRCGIHVQPVESLIEIGLENVAVFVVSEFYSREISAQLTALGFIKGINFFVFGSAADNMGDGFSLLSDSAWAEAKSNIDLGHSYYRQVFEKYGRIPIWFMHQPSIGDLHVFSLFLPQAMNVKSIGDCNCVLIVTKKSVQRYALALGYKNVELVPYEDAMTKLVALIRLAGDKVQMKNAVFYSITPFLDPLVWHSRFNFLDSFTKFVFGFDEVPMPIPIRLPNRRAVIEKQFADHGLVPGKTVLISPYAGMFNAELKPEQWAFLVRSLLEKGYSVCTNSAGGHEPPLPNSQAPFIELQDCVEFVETAGYFIGIRSGFCDAICDAKCLKIIICDASANHAPLEYFGFASMGIGSDIVELKNDGVDADLLFQSILDYF